MVNIVEYTDRKWPVNRYPYRIVSPARAGACCFSDMEDLGPPRRTRAGCTSTSAVGSAALPSG